MKTEEASVPGDIPDTSITWKERLKILNSLFTWGKTLG
jgi:hypothetical protein